MSLDRTRLVKAKLKQVLNRAASILFPLQREEIHKLVKPHTWRDRNYVGSVGGKVCAWSGYSINLAYLDSRYRGLFGDYVLNHLPVSERLRLFGDEFTSATQSLSSFVVIFNLDIPLDSIEIVSSLGFIPRTMNRSSHICIIYSPEEFLDTPLDLICLKVAEMVILQRNIAIHRQPLDSLELPFQHFLYQSNYLHGLVVKSGLWLKSISEPRKSGEFGHDMEIQAISPQNQQPITIGVEVFMKGWGYHTNSVPSYVEQFSLNGLIVISKDIPEGVLRQLQASVNLDIILVSRLRELDYQLSAFPIYHLALGDLVNELFNLSDQLKNILNQSRTVDLERRQSSTISYQP
jgi:hypothetical protein